MRVSLMDKGSRRSTLDFGALPMRSEMSKFPVSDDFWCQLFPFSRRNWPPPPHTPTHPPEAPRVGQRQHDKGGAIGELEFCCGQQKRQGAKFANPNWKIYFRQKAVHVAEYAY